MSQPEDGLVKAAKYSCCMLLIYYILIIFYIFVNCNWVDARWHSTVHIYTQTEHRKTQLTTLVWIYNKVVLHYKCISSSSSSSCSWRVRRVSCSLILKMKLVLHLFLGRPMFLRPFGLYCSACFGSLFVSILCTCCSHFFWYCFISFTMFCAPVFCLIHWKWKKDKEKNQ